MKRFHVYLSNRLGGWSLYRPKWNPRGVFRYERAKQVEKMIEDAGGDARVREVPAAAGDDAAALIRERLTGDITVEASAPAEHHAAMRELLLRLARAARACDETWHVLSGYRSYEEQARLYAAYLAGTGSLAARPGTSNHNRGRAADVYCGGVAIGASSRRRAACAAQGLGFPVGGEAWHVEIVT